MGYGRIRTASRHSIISAMTGLRSCPASATGRPRADPLAGQGRMPLTDLSNGAVPAFGLEMQVHRLQINTEDQFWDRVLFSTSWTARPKPARQLTGAEVTRDLVA